MGEEMSATGDTDKPDQLRALTVREVATRLGVSREVVQRLIMDGGLAAFRVGRGRKRKKWMVREVALLQWIESQEERPVSGR